MLGSSRPPGATDADYGLLQGGFSYVVAPDGVLFELTGGPDTRPSLSHVHFFQSGNLYTRPDAADFNAVVRYADDIVAGFAALATDPPCASSHNPSCTKMCDGMCSACSASGAIFAYARAAASPRDAYRGLSVAWMR